MDLTSIVSLVIAVAAALTSIVTLYFTSFRRIRLVFAISHSAYVSNTYGGVPDLFICIALRANGPTTKAIAVDSIRVRLTNMRTNTTIELINNPIDKILPAVVGGGDAITKRVMFVTDMDLSEEIRRYDDWCDRLVSAFPSKKELIDDIRAVRKNRFIYVADYSEKTQSTDGVEGSDTTSLERQLELSAKEELANSRALSDLLRSAPVEKIENLVFFSTGKYSAKFEVFDVYGNHLAVENRYFEIGSLVSNNLIHRFNANMRIVIQRESST